MSNVKKRTLRVPPNADQILDGKKGSKRPVYKPAYPLFTSAYIGAYRAAYLPFTERARMHGLNQIWLVLRAEKIASPRAS